MGMRGRLLALVMGVLLWGAPSVVAAEGFDPTPVGGDFRISTSTFDEFGPEVVWNATADEYFVVWQDQRSQATRGSEVFGRRVSSGGVVLGSDIRISNSSANENWPSVAWNATANEYLVVWEDERSAATRDLEIFGRRVSATGTLLGTDFRISNSSGGESIPTVAWNGTTNQYLVVWEDYRSTATRGDEIYARRVSATGSVLGSDVRISTSTADERDPVVTWNATENQFLVVWTDRRNQGTRGTEVFGRRVGADGVVAGVDFRISSSTANEGGAAVTWNASTGQYFVVWEDDRNVGTRGDEIYGRLVSGVGVPVGTDLRLSNSTLNESDTDVVWNQTANQYVVVWEDDRSVGTRGYEIYGRRVGANGSLIGGNFRVSGSIAGEITPSIAWGDALNQYLIVWQDTRKVPTRGNEIYGRRITGDAPA